MQGARAAASTLPTSEEASLELMGVSSGEEGEEDEEEEQDVPSSSASNVDAPFVPFEIVPSSSPGAGAISSSSGPGSSSPFSLATLDGEEEEEGPVETEELIIERAEESIALPAATSDDVPFSADAPTLSSSIDEASSVVEQPTASPAATASPTAVASPTASNADVSEEASVEELMALEARYTNVPPQETPPSAATIETAIEGQIASDHQRTEADQTLKLAHNTDFVLNHLHLVQPKPWTPYPKP